MNKFYEDKYYAFVYYVQSVKINETLDSFCYDLFLLISNV